MSKDIDGIPQSNYRSISSCDKDLLIKGALSPADVIGIIELTIPEKAYKAFNELLISNFNEGVSRIKHTVILKTLSDALGITPEQVVSKGYINIIEVYKTKGWTVTGINTSTDTIYMFR